MTLNLKNKDKEYIANTYGRFDLEIDYGKGALCYDSAGNQYIDFTSGIGVNSLGFSNDKWLSAITSQAGKLQHVSNLFYSEPQVALAEKLIKRTAMSKVFFGNSGAEANECAIKTARKYGNEKSENQKNEIITLKNGFHGRTIATITATGQEHYHQYFHPFAGGFKYCPANDFAALTSMISDKTCGVMLEMIQGEGGVLMLDENFVGQVAKLCSEKDILLIVDEVQTGIGRTGTLFAYEQFNIKPDIVTFAKGIGAGLPIGGALLGEKVKDVLGHGDHGTTFGGNPVVCAGASIVLDTLSDQFLSEIKEKGSYIMEKLHCLEGIHSVSGMGLMVGFKVDNTEASDFVRKCMKDGLLMLTAKDRVRLLPPLIITYKDIDDALAIIEKNLQ